MPTSLQFRRGTTSQNNSFTGSVGEISIDTTIDTLRVHDGSTAGGFEITSNAATQTLTNKTLTSPTINGPVLAMSTNRITGVGDPSGAQDAATKAYVDSGLSSLSSTTLTEGNSSVIVADSGTGTVTVTIDGSTHSTFAAAGITLAQGNFVGNVTGNTSGSSGSCTGNAATFTSQANSATITAASTNTANQIVLRDGSGNFSAGTITATATAAQYADLAERYTTDEDYEEGTVLVFGGDEEVTQCTNKFDKRIAGVVSTDPAYLMNSELEGASVALVGRVPCKVIGEIRKGDLMVASDTPGHAEAWRDESNPPAGSIIGKSLENKIGASTDVIEVVVGKN